MTRLAIRLYYPRTYPELYIDLSLLLLKLFKDLTTRIGQEKSRQSSRLLSISNAKCTTQFDR